MIAALHQSDSREWPRTQEAGPGAPIKSRRSNSQIYIPDKVNWTDWEKAGGHWEPEGEELLLKLFDYVIAITLLLLL